MQWWRPAHLRSAGANFSRRRKNLFKKLASGIEYFNSDYRYDDYFKKYGCQ
jgi:hypothetical protein